MCVDVCWFGSENVVLCFHVVAGLDMMWSVRCHYG